MKESLHEEIRRINQIMNINEGKDNDLLYLKRRISGEAAHELFPNAISQASTKLKEKKGKWNAINVDKFKNMVISLMFDSFLHDFIVRKVEIPDDLNSDELWDYLVRVFGDKIEEIYYDIIKEDGA